MNVVSAVYVSGHSAQARHVGGLRRGELSFDLRGDLRGGEAVFLAQILDGAGVLDELVGPADAHDRRGDVLFVEQFAHRRP